MQFLFCWIQIFVDCCLSVMQFLNSIFLRLQFLLCWIQIFVDCCFSVSVVLKYLLFLYSRFGLYSFWTLKLLFLYSNTCYSLFNFFFPALQFFLLFGIIKKKMLHFCFFRFCNTFVTVFRFFSVLQKNCMEILP